MTICGWTDVRRRSFEVAWQKPSWYDEMKTIYDGWYSFDDITLLMKKKNKGI